MRTLRIYSINNFHIYYKPVLTIVIMLYVIFLVLLYFIIGSLYLLTTRIQFLLPLTPAFGKHTFELFL